MFCKENYSTALMTHNNVLSTLEGHNSLQQVGVFIMYWKGNVMFWNNSSINLLLLKEEKQLTRTIESSFRMTVLCCLR